MIGRQNGSYVQNHQHGKCMVCHSCHKEIRKETRRYSEPTRPHTLVNSHQTLVDAIESIASGRMNQDYFSTTSGLDRERLRTAQSLRDRGIEYNIPYVVRAGHPELSNLSKRYLPR